MKRIAFLMVTLFMISGFAMSQGRHKKMKMDPQERAQKMTERMSKEFSLNEDQQKQLLEVNQNRCEMMAKRMEEMKAKKQEMRQEMKANQDAFDSQLKKIMTKDQYEAFINKQAKRQHKMKNEKHRRPNGPDAE